MKKLIVFLLGATFIAALIFILRDSPLESARPVVIDPVAGSASPVREHVVSEGYDWTDPKANKRLLDGVGYRRPKDGTVLIKDGETLVTSGIMSERGAFVFHTFTPTFVSGGIMVKMGRKEIDLSGAETEHSDNEVTLTPNEIQVFTSIRETETVSVSVHAKEDAESGSIALRISESLKESGGQTGTADEPKFDSLIQLP